MVVAVRGAAQVAVASTMATLARRKKEVAMNQANQSVDKLNEFLRGELSAVETYRQALEKIDVGGTRVQLEQCRRSHEERVALLRRSITTFGGQPASTSGAWGSFAKLAEGGAKVFGEKAAIAALEEGEDHGLKLYRNDLEKLDPTAQELVRTDLLPAQERTHRALSDLKHSLH
jgi:demethoxyubiquinone hydroxylase (CLK1/Coq7/Cat5 family)